MDSGDRQMPARWRFFMALAFFAFGLFLFGFVFGWIDKQPSRTPTPDFVIASAAMMFTLAGVIILLIENERLAWLRNLASWLFLVCLAIPFNWIAFGEGERVFSSSSSMIGAASSGSASETEGRVVFGIFAVLMDMLIVYAAWRFLQKRKNE